MSNSTPAQKSLLVESVPSTGLADKSENKEHRDALYVFACHFEWCSKRSLVAYQEVLAAIDDHDCDIRILAQELLFRSTLRLAD